MRHLIRADLVADVPKFDNTGFVWSFLDEADEPAPVRRDR
jgi:hypothetical protein